MTVADGSGSNVTIVGRCSRQHGVERYAGASLSMANPPSSTATRARSTRRTGSSTTSTATSSRTSTPHVAAVPAARTPRAGTGTTVPSTIIAVADGLSMSQQQQVFNATPGKPGHVTWTGGNNILNLYQQLLAAINNLGGNETGGPAAVDQAIIGGEGRYQRHDERRRRADRARRWHGREWPDRHTELVQRRCARWLAALRRRSAHEWYRADEVNGAASCAAARSYDRRTVVEPRGEPRGPGHCDD